jgi:hypothetical protein
LAQIVQKHPELARLIEVWPSLPKRIKSKIRDLIENHSTERKTNGKSDRK